MAAKLDGSALDNQLSVPMDSSDSITNPTFPAQTGPPYFLAAEGAHRWYLCFISSPLNLPHTVLPA